MKEASFKHWIAGMQLNNAIQRAKFNQKKGIQSIINVLGEEQKNPKIAEQKTKEYLKLIRQIKKHKLNASISVKLTNIGLSTSKIYALMNLYLIAEEAFRQKMFVWIDMEESRHSDSILSTYYHASKFFQNIGITIQAYLKRSKKDVKRLLKKHAIIRLVKGAYKESIALHEMHAINKNFEFLMKECSKKGKIVIATHDIKLIEKAMDLVQKKKQKGRHRNRKGSDLEIQMLMGVHDELKQLFAESGYQISEYIPYGKHWHEYYKRRLKEYLM